MVTATIEQTIIERRMYTAAEFEAMSLGDRRFELIAGELIEMGGAGGQHGRIGVRFVSRLDRFTDERGLGSTYGADTGFIVQERPDTVLVPDAAYIQLARTVPEDEQTGFVRVVPDLVLEIVSPSDSRREVADKVALYLAVGVKIIIVADPKTMTFVVHRPGESSLILTEDDVFTAGDLIPGFSVRVGDIMRPRSERVATSNTEPGE